MFIDLSQSQETDGSGYSMVLGPLARGRIVIAGSAARDRGDDHLTTGRGRARLFRHESGCWTLQAELESNERHYASGGDPREPEARFQLQLCTAFDVGPEDLADGVSRKALRVRRGLQTFVYARYEDTRVQELDGVDLSIQPSTSVGYRLVICAGALDNGSSAFQFDLDAEISHCQPQVPSRARLVRYDISGQMAVDEDLGRAPLKSILDQCDLHRNPCLTDTALLALANVSDITQLNISATSIAGNTLLHLKSAPRIRSINFDQAQLNDAGSWGLRKFERLERLSCEGTAITDSSLSALADMKRLTSLNLSGTAIVGVGLESIVNLKCLTHLNLSGCQLSKSAVSTLSSMKRLRHVRLDRCGLLDEDLDALMPLVARVDYIGLHDNPISDAAFMRVRQKLPSAVVLGRKL